MTVLAEKITNESLNLTKDDQLEVISRLASRNGSTEFHEHIENTIAEHRLDDLKSGRDKGMSHEEVFSSYRR